MVPNLPKFRPKFKNRDVPLITLISLFLEMNKPQNPELGPYLEGDMLENPGESRRTFVRNARIWPEGIIPAYIHETIRKY